MIKINKIKFVPVVLSFVLLLASFPSALFAQEDILSDPRLDSLSKKYGVEFVPIEIIQSRIQSNDNNIQQDPSKASELEPLKFKDMDEYEQFLAQLRADLDKHEVAEFSIDPSNPSPSSDPSLITTMNSEDTYIISWAAPFTAWGLAGAFATKNITINYSYKYVNNWPQYTGVSSIKSHLGGLNLIGWEQTGGSKTYSQKCSPKDTANIKVVGYFLLGAEINGFPLGSRMNDTWEGSLSLHPPATGCF
ncbi:hypothetical protein J7E78_01355 [Paenibacillus polymyxa]|uniref:hypothetical protein n=1 Tax=Paenibacillus polymyxa TaxID=1406 RepID=UPI001BEBEAA8|nr:hypothetical protein [Paenibacillus polymyxa]MBT2282199.1 hypothetical protein [Paenibacillus polymyxa]